MGLLGSGGMGVVFRSVREPDGMMVALKLLRAELSADAMFRRRFTREASLARSVHHPHLVPIHEAGEADGWQYYAAALIEGEPLSARIRRSLLPMTEVARIVAQVAGALDALHESGIIHRDVKPSNILLDRAQRAMLTDFGLAKGAASTVLTAPGRPVGTIAYQAPELLSGGPASSATDVYALGCVAYEAVTGASPFSGRGMLELAMAHLVDDPSPPSVARPGLSSGADAAILAALAKDPGHRPPTATAYARLISVASLGIR